MLDFTAEGDPLAWTLDIIAVHVNTDPLFLEYRTLHGGEEEGICIHVYGNDIPGQDKELLRFDCFRVAPHYHYRNSSIKKNERLMLDFTAEGDPLAWTLDKIKTRLPIMLLRCGSDNGRRNGRFGRIDPSGSGDLWP